VPLVRKTAARLPIERIRQMTGSFPHRPSAMRATLLRLVSRSAVPLELGVARDARELGVAFEWLAVRKGSRCRMVGAEDARLTDGFHPFEAAEGIRWTNGDALLPGELFAGFKGEFEVAIQLGGATSYADVGDLRRAA
jgi:hypothetical protein